jgi:hypothetical protein
MGKENPTLRNLRMALAKRVPWEAMRSCWSQSTFCPMSRCYGDFDDNDPDSMRCWTRSRKDDA